MSIYIGDKEIKNLFVGGSTSVSDMQGPCPDGFHVPTIDEWTDVYNKRANTSSIFRDYLKMPFAGYRSTNSSTYSVGSDGRYWTISPSSRDSYYFYMSSSSVSLSSTMGRGYALSIRPFKDEAVTPDDSWTLLTTLSMGYKIYHNSSLGLISIGTGENWITIADKNLGATQVYTNGDTMSEANCGKCYQWGNNYGFPFTGTVTTSSTLVDASNYGPGNYYSSNTFITATSSPYDRSSVQNNNLRGGVTQGTTEKGAVKAVYLGENKVRPPIPPYVIDYVVQDKTGAESASLSYYYGVAFTPNKDCTLDKVFFLGSTSGTLKIAQGNYASSNTSSVTYSISSVTEYELPTPYQLTANTRYTVSVYGSFFSKYSISMQTGSNVTFNYGTNSSTNRTYASNDYTVRGLQTTAT